MTATRGVIQNGQVILCRAVELPDGTEVDIRLVSHSQREDDEGPLTGEEIARLLALRDQMQPLERTDQDRAARQADRQARREWEKAHFTEHADKLQRMWQ